MIDYINAFRNILDFNGNSTRKEFWNFFFINMLVNIIVRLAVKYFSIPDYFYNVYIVITLLAFIAIGFRRLNNAGKTRWLFLIPIVNLIFALLPEKEFKEH